MTTLENIRVVADIACRLLELGIPEEICNEIHRWNKQEQEKVGKEGIYEEYQGIANPVYDILLSHMDYGAKAKPNRMIIEADHHAISFEIQTKLRELGYHRHLK